MRIFHLYVAAILTTFSKANTETKSSFLNVLLNVPDFQQGLVQALPSSDIEKMATVNRLARHIMESPYILRLRIEKYVDHLINFDLPQKNTFETTFTIPIIPHPKGLADMVTKEEYENNLKKFPYSANPIIKQYPNLRRLYLDLVWLQKYQMSFSDAKMIFENDKLYQYKFNLQTGVKNRNTRNKFYIRQAKLQLYLGVLTKTEYNQRIETIQNGFIPNFESDIADVFSHIIEIALMGALSIFFLDLLPVQLIIHTLNTVELVFVLEIILKSWKKSIQYRNLGTLVIE